MRSKRLSRAIQFALAVHLGATALAYTTLAQAQQAAVSGTVQSVPMQVAPNQVVQAQGVATGAAQYVYQQAPQMHMQPAPANVVYANPYVSVQQPLAVQPGMQTQMMPQPMAPQYVQAPFPQYTMPYNMQMQTAQYAMPQNMVYMQQPAMVQSQPAQPVMMMQQPAPQAVMYSYPAVSQGAVMMQPAATPTQGQPMMMYRAANGVMYVQAASVQPQGVANIGHLATGVSPIQTVSAAAQDLTQSTSFGNPIPVTGTATKPNIYPANAPIATLTAARCLTMTPR